MNILKQSTAATIKLGPFVDDTDGKTAETALSIATADVRLSKNGGANGAKNSTTATSHNELGYYNVHLSATDTNTLGALKVMISMAGALPVWADFMVVHAKVYDALFSTGLVELIAAYDKAKDDVLTPLAVVDALIDTLITRLTETRAGNLDKLAIGAGNTLAHTGNANTFKADVSALALEATLTAMKGQGFLQDAGTLASIYDKLYTTFGNTDLNQLKARLDDIKGAGWTVDDNLKNILTAAASADSFAEDAAGWGRIIANPTTGELFAARDAILAAIEAIDGGGSSMTPEQIRAAVGLALANLDTQLSGILTAIGNIEADVDLTGIATSADVESIKDDVIAAMPTIPNDYAKETNATANKEAVIAAIPAVPNDYAKPSDIPTVEEIQDGIAKTSELPVIPDDYAKEATLTAGIDDVLEAIDDKPVTPAVDISELATKLDLDVLAKAADLDELLTMLTTVANDTGTTVPQLVASLPAKVWSYIYRTLTVSAIRPQTLLEGDQYSIYKDASVLIPITALGDITDYANLWFTMKREMDLESGDEKSIIHIDLLTGLLYVNQAVANNALGGIVVVDSEAGNLNIWLAKEASALLPLFSKEPLRWEVKGLSSEGVNILLQGTNYILPAVTRKIS